MGAVCGRRGQVEGWRAGRKGKEEGRKEEARRKVWREWERRCCACWLSALFCPHTQVPKARANGGEIDKCIDSEIGAPTLFTLRYRTARRYYNLPAHGSTTPWVKRLRAHHGSCNKQTTSRYYNLPALASHTPWDHTPEGNHGPWRELTVAC